MSLLSVIQSKVREQAGGCMYVKTKVGGNKLQATVDLGVDTIHIVKELANEISLPYRKEKSYMKGINANSLPIHGIARGMNIPVGPWRGTIDITVAPLDNWKFYLGMNFLDKAKAIIISHGSTLFIMDKGLAHEYP